MFLFIFISFLYSEMTQNIGANYFASSKGARSSYMQNDAIIINPANLVINDTNLFNVNSYYSSSYFGLGTSINFEDSFAIFFSLDELDKSFSYDGMSVFTSYAFSLSKRFAVGASIGYYSSAIFQSGLKYSTSISISPWDLNKKTDKWIISTGYLRGFGTDNSDEYFISYTYFFNVFSVSLDFITSNVNEMSDNNEEVFSFKFLLTDDFELLSSAKVMDISTDNTTYGFGLNYLAQGVKLGFSYFYDYDKSYFAFNISAFEE